MYLIIRGINAQGFFCELTMLHIRGGFCFEGRYENNGSLKYVQCNVKFLTWHGYDVRSFGQYDVRWFFISGRACEFFAVLYEAGHKAAVWQKELSVLDTYEAAEPIRFACRIVAESGRIRLNPPTLSRANPLVSDERVKNCLMVSCIASGNVPMISLHVCSQQKPVIVRFQGP